MENGQFAALVSQIRSSGRITAEDVLRLRRYVYGGRTVAKTHMEALLDLNKICADRSPEWADLFTESIADFVVEQEEPRGYVDDANASWLIEHLTRDGRIDTFTELEVIVGVLQRAKKSPDQLVRFALETVQETVIKGFGAARQGGNYKPGAVTESDVALLRRVLYAQGGDQHIAVSRAEAEVLFDINDATSEGENHPAWSDLFVKAVANSVLFYSGYVVPIRSEALRREQWLDEPADLGGFFSRMREGLAQAFSGYKLETPPAPDPTTEEHVIAARHVTEDEARWLRDRLQRDGKLHENERALLSFLREKSVHVHPVLQPVLARM